MNIFTIIKNKIISSVKEIANNKNIEIKLKSIERITVEPSRNKKHGDIATNVAMVLSKDFQSNPKDLAKEIVDLLKSEEFFNKIEIANPAFINLFCNLKLWQNFIISLSENKEYRFPNLGKNQKINLEYASPNPTGPMHIGHARGAIYGDVLSSLLIKTGHNVTKEYYVNDAGNQIDNLITSSYLRYLETFGKTVSFDQENLYPGEYLKELGKKLKLKYNDSLIDKDFEHYSKIIRDDVLDYNINIIISDLKSIGIEHNSIFSEKKELHNTGAIDKAIKILENKNLIYKGKVSKPETKKISNNNQSNEDQILFKATLFGDDKDRVIKKSDGNFTYFASDIAYALNKFNRGFKTMILPLGFDHAGYVKRLEFAVKAITNNQAKIKIILCQMVRFTKNGKIYKMSKRSGNFIDIQQVIEEVGVDILRFTMLSRKNDTGFDFDLQEVISQSKNNPIFYIQYAYARCSSIKKNTDQKILKELENEKSFKFVKYLSHDLEIQLIKRLSSYERTIETSVEHFEPHRIVFFLQELANDFHKLWHEGSENKELRFISSNKEITKARLLLIFSTMKIIGSALSIFNIEPMEEMY